MHVHITTQNNKHIFQRKKVYLLLPTSLVTAVRLYVSGLKFLDFLLKRLGRRSWPKGGMFSSSQLSRRHINIFQAPTHRRLTMRMHELEPTGFHKGKWLAVFLKTGPTKCSLTLLWVAWQKFWKSKSLDFHLQAKDVFLLNSKRIIRVYELFQQTDIYVHSLKNKKRQGK